MFIHVSVILSTIWCVGCVSGLRRWVDVWSEGVVKSEGGGSGLGGGVWWGVGEVDPHPEMATAAVGTHPTGMHS